VFTHASRRSGVIASALLGLVAAPLVVLSGGTPAQAAPSTGLVISEAYGGGGNSGATFTHDFVELFNPTDAEISVEGMSVQYRSQNGTSANVTSLTGSVPAGGYYLVQQASNAAVGDPLPTPDATGNASMSGSNGVVILASDDVAVSAQGDFAGTGNPANVIDTVGYGSGPTTFETANTGTPLTSSTSAQRAASGADTDDNSADFTVGAPTPTNTTAGDAPLSATDPGAQTAIVDAPVTPFTLEATGGTTPYTWEATGLPDGLALSTEGEVTGTPTVVDSYSVEATVTDAATPAAEDSVTFDFTITEPGEVVLISDIQGDGAESPLVDTTVTVEAVVTSVITASDVTDGFFIQEEDADADADPATSEGVYVFCRNSCPADLSAGDQLRVTGDVAEFNTTTQIDAAFGAGTFELLGSGAPLPTAAVVSLPAAASTLDAATFEDVEGMRTTISTTLAVSEYFNQARFGEIVLTAGERPYQFTQTNEPSVAGYDAFLADLATRRIVLDDDSNSQNAATSGPQDNEPYYYPTPGLSTGNAFRGGDTVTDLTGVFEYSFGAWKLRPVQGEDYTFEPTNPRPASPDEVGGRLKVASFNVLNYFATIDETSSNSSGPCGPAGTDDCRGADSEEERERQLAKIVDALATIDADVFGLIEIQNDTGLATEQIVDALNAATAPGTYDYIDTGFIGTDAIKQAFLYKTSTVTPVGEYETLTSAEDPLFVDTLNRPALIQTFDEVATGERVTVAVNHLKSKGSGCGAGDDSPEDGSGNCDGTRTAAAQALADYLATDPTGSGDPDFLVIGDLNSYSQERPIGTLEDNDYVDLLERFEGMESYGYLFDGQLGHLDQALATATLDDQVTGAGGWKINADENPLLDYNDTVADAGEASFERESSAETLFEPNAYRSSDHDPVVVGLDLGSAADDSVDVQILATNDFHGRIANDPFSSAAGAGVLAGAVKQLRSENPNTTFAAAGDLIGASTFESFVANDKPTIDALNEAGLDVSAVGNHEFDQGYDDLVNRVIAEYDEDTNPDGGAEWKYLGANVKFKASGDPALDGTWIKDQGGVQVGYVGAVTEHLPELVSPAGIAEIEVTDIVEATNAAADDLVDEGADIVVLLVHEGSPTTDCGEIAALGAGTDFGSIVQGVNDNVDAIVSGHTHLEYNCSLPVDGWSDRAVTERPVVSAGQYGTNLNQLVFTVDPATGDVQAKTQDILPLVSAGSANYPIDGATQDIVAAAVANADVLGAQPLGQIEAPFYRAKLANGTTENRGGESTLGNLVAEIQQDATEDPEFGSAQIAFMNPGGLRADLLGDGTGAFPRTVTFKQAANVQPFANTLVNMDLTGAEVKAALEQQWQPDGASRPFLKLGISEGFTYTYDASQAQGERIQEMFLDGEPIDLGATYSVTVNSFLASGGDNFGALNGSGRKQDTGRTDLQAQVDYFAEFASDAPLPVDYSQRAVGVDLASTSYTAGDDVVMGLSSLSMTGPGDINDTSVRVRLDGQLLGSFPVETTRQTDLPGYDEAGTATAVVTLPQTASGDEVLVVTGNQTGTRTLVPITVEAAEPVDVQILATNDFHGRIQSNGSEAGAAVLAGAVKQLRSENPNTTFAAAGDLIGASTFESFVANDKPTIDALNEAGLDVSAVGNHEFDQGYDDLVNRVIAEYDAEDNPFGGAEWKYLGANVKFKASGDPALDGTWIKDQGGVQVGYVGAVTEHLPELVSPDGIAEIEVTDIVEATNAAADDLVDEGADIVVLLVHEGAPTTSCADIAALGAGTDFGSIVQGVNDNVDAIVSGHTHLAYDCSFPVDGWSDRAVTERPVVSAGQYGTNLNQLVFTVDPATGDVQAKTQDILPLVSAGSANYPIDGATQDIVAAAVANADVLGAQPLGQIEAPFYRAKLANGTTENRGGESTLGNLVAEIQQDATEDPEFGSAQIAFMNPGGLRADLLGDGTGAFPRTVTFKQAANVQPFANTLVNMDLTGAEVKAALEQQWQPDGASRPFLKLGISEGFTYTYDASQAQGERIQEMFLDGEPIDLGATYSVTVNSFLASGGDNFGALNGSGRKQDTGRTDLQAQVDYFAEFASDAPLPVDYSQRAVGVVFPDAAPATYDAGSDVTFDLSSLSMTGPGDQTDASVDVSLDGTSLGTFPVTTTPLATLPGFDEAGTASASITLPGDLATGDYELVVTGSDTGTEAIVPVSVVGDGGGDLATATINPTAVPETQEVFSSSLINVLVSAEGVTATGTVELRLDGALLRSGTLNDIGLVQLQTGRLSETGTFDIDVLYLGDDNVAPGESTVTVTVVKQTPKMKVKAPNKVSKGSRPTVKVRLKGDNAQVSGQVVLKYAGKRATVTLDGKGKADAKLAKLKKNTTVKVIYQGDDFFERVKKKVTIKVTK